MNDTSENHATENEVHHSNDKLPVKGRLLGIDFGTKRVGFAISDLGQSIASPLDNYTRQGEQGDKRHLQKVVDEYEVKGLVIGLPVHMSGDEGGMAAQARKYGKWCEEVTGCPAAFWDERFSSSMAEEVLLEAGLSRKKRKARLDKLSAQMTLQSFLDAHDRQQKPVEYH